MPANPLQEPDDATYHSHQVECDEKIEVLKKEQKDLNLERKNKFREMVDDFSGKGGISKEFREQVDEQKQWLEEKRQILKLREGKDS